MMKKRSGMSTRFTLRRITACAIPVILGCAALTPIPATAAGATRVAGTITAISVTAPTSIPVGAYEVPLANIPTSVLGDGAGADGTPVRGVPVRGVPVRGVPVRGVPVRGVPVRGVPVRGVPVRGVPVRGVPVRGVPLSQIPLLPASGKTWPALLAAIPTLANKPLETISFGDFLDAAPTTDLTLGDIDLANSPLRSVPLEGWLLATVPASQIVYPGGSLCDLAKRQTGIAQCDSTVVNSIAYDYSITPTVLDLALAGIDFTSVPWARVPLAQITTDAPIRSIVLGGANGGSVANSALGALTLGALNYDKTTALSSASFNQSASLGSQQATFDTLAAANTPIKIGDLSLYNSAIQATDAETLGVRPTVADAMSTLFDSTSANWESANLSALNLPEYDPNQAPGTWTASVTAAAVTGSPAGSVVPTVVRLTLPDGFDARTATVLANGTTLTPNSVKVDGVNALVDVDAPSGVAMSLTFTALGPLDIRTTGASSTLSAAPFGGPSATATSGATTVVARGTPHVKIASNVLNFDYINSSATDTTATFTYPAPAAGTRVFALLGNLPADYDMVVYGPAGGLSAVNSSPFRSVAQTAFIQRPAQGLNLTGGLKQDPGVDNGPATSAPVSGQIAELPLHQGANNLPVVGVSNSTGTGSEEVGWVSEGGGTYTIVVSGKSGANSPKPFTLRIRTINPAPTVACKPATPFGTAVTYPATGIDLVAAPTPAATSPIAVIDRVAFQARYGAAATTAMWNSLVAFRTQPDNVPLRFITLDTDAAYAAAAQQRMANPCDLISTFSEVDRISSLIRAAKAANPQAASVIMVGSDEQLPMARVRDQAWTFNEAEFADEAADKTPNPISVSAQQGFMLSDTPYAISTPSLAGQEALMLPDMGIGRLVESPTQIQGLLDSYTKNLGQLYVTKKGFSYQRYGYGFLTDGTNAIGANLAAGTGIEAAGSAVNDSWDGSALTASGGAFSATGGAAVTVLNAHFDPRRLLAACGDPIVTPAPSCLTPLVGPSAAIAPSLPGKLLMSLGCHSGLNMPNGYFPVGSALATDWTETLANQGAAVWVGNTGYGYGDSDVVAYSEKLMTNFADQLTLAPNAGLALTYAKQQYQASSVALSDIDLKVMAESTLYGLPLWTSKNSNRTAPTKVTRALTGSSASLSYADLSVAPTLTSVASSRGTYYTVTASGATASVAATPGQPLVPHLDLPFTQTTPSILNSRLRGVEVMSLTGTALTTEDPVISRAVVDSSVREGEPAVPNTVWPASVQTASWMTTAVGDEDRVGLNPTVTFPKAGGLVDRENFTNVGVRAYYSTASRLVPPVIQRIDVSGTALTVTAVKSDNSADNQAIDHVSVLGWDGVTPGGWAKYGPVVGLGPTFGFTIAANTKYLYVQVVDQGGDVSSTWKVITPGIVTSSAGNSTLYGPAVAGAPGKFTGPVTISASWPTGAHIKLGTPGAVDSPNPATVSSTQNAYLVDGYNAVQKAWALRVDNTPPVTPTAGAGQIVGANGATVIVPATSAAGAVVNFPTMAGDSGDVGPVPYTCLPATGSVLPVGSTKVGCQAVDSSGNRNFTTFTVTVQDPYITVPSPITAEATGPTGAVVTYSASANDTVDGVRPVSCAPASGSTFAIGTTTVSCTASDTRGLVSTSTFTVTVQDTTAPVLSLPTSVAATATSASGAVVTYTASATDKVDGTRTVSCTPASGSTFAVAATTVSCTSSDTRLNTATGSFVVSVAKAADTTLPTVTFSPVSGGTVICKSTCVSTALKFVTADPTTNSTWQTVSGVASVTYYTATTASTQTTTPLVWSKGVAYAVTGGSVTIANTAGNKQWVRIDVKDAAGNLTQGIWWVKA